MFPESNNGYWEYGLGGFPIVGGRPDNLLEGFEDGDIEGYGGDTGRFTVQSSNVLKGRQTLQSLSGYEVIGDDGGDFPTTRTKNPTEYRARVYAEGGGDVILCTNVQDEGSPFQNCYAATIDTPDNEFRFYKRRHGATEYFERNSMPLSANKEYLIFIVLTNEGINAGVRDSDNSLIFRTDSYRDTTFSGGGLGWRKGAGTTGYFDHCTVHPGHMGPLLDTIDDFEDGNLNEYFSESSTGHQNTKPSAAYDGNYGLVQDGFTSLMSIPGDGLDNYLEDGKEYEFYFNFRNGGSPQHYIYLCPQSRNSTENTYELEFIFGDNVMRIQKDKNGSESTLSGHGTGEENFAYTNDINWSTSNWYRVEVRLYNGIRARVYDESSGKYLGYVRSKDTEFFDTENGLGFFCSGSGRWFVDEIKEI